MTEASSKKPSAKPAETAPPSADRLSLLESEIHVYRWLDWVVKMIDRWEKSLQHSRIPMLRWLGGAGDRWEKKVERWEQKFVPLSREGKLWLLFALGLLATGLFRSINLINLLSCFMLAALMLNLWSAWRQLRSLRGQRIVDQAIFAQAPSTALLKISNDRKRTARGLSLVQQDQERFLANLPGKRIAEEVITLLFQQRGRHMLAPFQVRCGYPLGLADFGRVLTPAEEIIILPRLGHLRRGALRRHLQQHSPTIGQARTVPRRHPAAQTDFHGLRAFQPGDSPRWIHWRTSARRSELMVKEFEETPTDNLIVILDPFRSSDDASNDQSVDLERAISLAATVCWEWCRQKGDRLVLAIGGDSPIVVGGITSTELAIDMLRCLAVQKGSPRTDVVALFDRLAEGELPTAATLVISTHDCEYFDELQQKTRRTLAHINVARQEYASFYEE